MKLVLGIALALVMAACGGAPDGASAERAEVVAGVAACGPLFTACQAAAGGVTNCTPEGNAWSCECDNPIGNNTAHANYCTYTVGK